MNWDDFRIIAAVKEEGTYAAASARLRIDETTVSRRLARLERDLGLRLFEAVDGLRRPTAQCDAVLIHVQAMARHVAGIGKVSETASGPVGRFRIACTSALAEEVLAPRADELLALHPGLTVQFLTSSENVNFSGWEADLAIRLRKPEKGDFTISKLAELQACFIEPVAGPDGGPVVCGYPADLDFTPESRFLQAKGLQQRLRCVTDNPRIIKVLIRTHRAAGILPEYMCRDLAADRRLRITPLPKGREAWLLVQNHLRRDPGARLVIEWIRDCFRRLSPLTAAEGRA